MDDIVGNAVDQLVTVEAKNRGFPHDILKPLYDAARGLVDGRPISMVAAQRLKDRVAPGEGVLLMTGCGYQPALPKGETDGPPGAASLARIVHRGLHGVPVFACEADHVDVIAACCRAAGVAITSLDAAKGSGLGAAILPAPREQSAVAAWVDDVIARTAPAALISSERLGPASDGAFYGATAVRLPDPSVVNIASLCDRARAEGALTIGIGDHGNEIGFAAIRDAVVATMPNGETLVTVTPTDIVFPAMMSNWGCYAIEACLAFLLADPDLMHDGRAEERILRAAIAAGALEAVHCTPDFLVDGLRGEVSMAVCEFLRAIVSKNLETTTRGNIH